jgi:putative salt-induced outer membrane protein YdiY
MRNPVLVAGVMAASAALSSPAAADEPTPDGWRGELAFSYLLKRGNTDSDSIVTKGDGEYESENWRHSVELEAVNTTSENQTTGENERVAERYYLSYKLDRRLGPKQFIFNVGTYEKDLFSGYHYRFSYALGYGRSLLDTERQELSLELGPGYRSRCLEPEDSYSDCDTNRESAIMRLAGQYRWDISESAFFREKLKTEVSSDEGSVSRAETSLSSQINDTMTLRLSHLLKHSSQVPAGREETDQEITVSLVIGF